MASFTYRRIQIDCDSYKDFGVWFPYANLLDLDSGTVLKHVVHRSTHRSKEAADLAARDEAMRRIDRNEHKLE